MSGKRKQEFHFDSGIPFEHLTLIHAQKKTKQNKTKNKTKQTQ